MSKSAVKQGRMEEAGNPFLAPVEPTPVQATLEEEGDSLLGPAGEERGPELPPGAPALTGPRVLSAEGTSPPATISVVGLHGGAGTTTVQRILARGSGEFAWVEAPRVGAVPEHGAVVLVARTSGAGLERAHAAAREWGEGSHPDLALLGLVLTADGPRTPGELRAAAKRVARMYPRAWRLEWVPAWHLTARPSLESIPRRAAGMRKKIHRWAADRGLEGTPKEKNA